MKELIGHKASSDRIQTLQEHVRNVERIAEQEGEKLGIKNIMGLIALLHDMGKAGSDFQKYISQGRDVKVKRGSINHSSVGARWVYARYKDTKDGKFSKELLAELISYTISAHHALYDITTIEGEDKFRTRICEKTDCYDEARERFEKEVLGNEIGIIDEKFKLAYCELKNVNEKIKLLMELGDRKTGKKFYYGCFERLLLSILVDADWNDTTQFMRQEKKEKIEYEEIKYQDIYKNCLDKFHHYMEKLHKDSEHKMFTKKEKEIRTLRDSIQEECVKFAQNDNGIYCLPIPTGGGKTLSGLAYALEYAKRHPETEKIIYVSHFLTVIEQNTKEMKKVIGEENAKWVLEHHSNIITEDEDEKKETEENKHIWDLNWEEPFICTTMVQFFQTLFSDKNQSVRRFHRLKNAVIILDEIQSCCASLSLTYN